MSKSYDSAEIVSFVISLLALAILFLAVFSKICDRESTELRGYY